MGGERWRDDGRMGDCAANKGYDGSDKGQSRAGLADGGPCKTSCICETACQETQRVGDECSRHSQEGQAYLHYQHSTAINHLLYIINYVNQSARLLSSMAVCKEGDRIRRNDHGDRKSLIPLSHETQTVID